eukprot:gene3757-15038_t
MEHRIELERRGRDKEKVTELNLDNCRSTNVIGLEDFKNLKILSLINVGLTTLKGFPALPELRKLELSDNRVSGGLDNLLKCPKLTHLSLSGNKIKDFEALDSLADIDERIEVFALAAVFLLEMYLNLNQAKDLKELKSLDLFNCEVTSEKEYRQRLFSLVPSLEFLDGTDKDDQEIEDDDEEEVDDVDGEDDDEEDGLDDEVCGIHEEAGGTITCVLKQFQPLYQDEEDEGEFEPEDDEEDEEEDLNEDEDEDEEEPDTRGQKRKREGEDD